MTEPGSNRLAEDVQRFGLLSAAAVVDRYRQLVDKAIGDADVDDTMPGGLERVDPSWLVDRASRLAGGYLRFLETAASALESRPDPPSIERVALAPVRPGGVTEGSFWVHNPTDSPTGSIEVRSTALVSVGGHSIPGGHVDFEPAISEPIGPGGKIEVTLSVDVPPDIIPGRYLGLIYLLHAGDDPIAFDIEVRTG